jgi:hypothetical protein
MNSTGLGVLLGALAALALLLVGLFFFAPVRSASAPATAAPATGSLNVSTSLERTPSGLRAVVHVQNGLPRNVRDFQITRIAIPGMTCDSKIPSFVRSVNSGCGLTVSIPFSGPSPAPNSQVHLDVDYAYETDLFGKGGGSSGVTSVVP